MTEFLFTALCNFEEKSFMTIKYKGCYFCRKCTIFEVNKGKIAEITQSNCKKIA